jgi:hypothetical protein
MNSPCAPSLWRGVQLFLGKHVSLPACFGQLVFWLIVTGFSLITSPPLFTQTNDNKEAKLVKYIKLRAAHQLIA